MHRVANHQAGQPSGTDDPPPPRHGLTQADLVAACRREPAAVTRVYSAYAPALFRFFMAAVGDRHLAEDLTGTTFVSAIEALPRFRGPVEALGGWLFQIARHDLYDHRRKQARSRIEPLGDNLSEAAVTASAPGVLAQESGTETGLWSDQVTHPALDRLSPEDLEAVATGHLKGTQLAAALQQLSPEQREVLMLHMVAGLTVPEVATALGKTVGEVKALRHRGLVSLTRGLGLGSSDQSQERPSPLDPDYLS
jgi:RNA polymerase sigma-70 factor, ECF subfamily